MTNQEFLQLVIEDRKIPYNDQLLTLLHHYFKMTIEDLEKKTNFNYMRVDTYITLLANQYSIRFTEDIKQFNDVIDKQKGAKLVGDDDTKAYYLYNPDRIGIPSRFFYSSKDKTLYFDCKVDKPKDYILSYYVFTYKTNLVELANTHPLIEENKALILHGMSFWIERYFDTNLSTEMQLKTFQEALERSTQMLKRYKKSNIKVYFRRY